MVCDAIAHPRSAFEQYHALLAARRLSVVLDTQQRERLRHFVSRRVAHNRHLGAGTDRAALARNLAAALGGA